MIFSIDTTTLGCSISTASNQSSSESYMHLDPNPAIGLLQQQTGTSSTPLKHLDPKCANGESHSANAHTKIPRRRSKVQKPRNCKKTVNYKPLNPNLVPVEVSSVCTDCRKVREKKSTQARKAADPEDYAKKDKAMEPVSPC